MIKSGIDWIKNNPNRFMFLIPIILVAGISISHVVAWYDISNPINWAIYLSIAIEVGAMTALVAATNKIKGGVWFMFGVVTLVQMVGNVFYSYKEIDSEGELFKSWVELSSPFWEMLGTSATDTIALKRWLAVLSGGLLPIISLTSLHFFVNYESAEKEEGKKTEIITDEPEPVIETPVEIENIENEIVEAEPILETPIDEPTIIQEEPIDIIEEEQPIEPIMEERKKPKRTRAKKEPNENVLMDETSTTTTTLKLVKLKYTKPS